jgi:hypothetical protein
MKNFLLLILILPVISACSLDTIGNNSDNINVAKNADVISETELVNEENLDCAQLGEAEENFDYTAGQVIIGGKSCCQGLKPISLCTCDGDGLCSASVGGGGICASCGDGVCNSEYENTCNCAEDCGR